MKEKKSLSSLRNYNTPIAKVVPALYSENLGNPTLKLQLSIKDFLDTSDVFNKNRIEELQMPDGTDAQRKLSDDHARKLAKYILGGLFDATFVAMKSKGQQISQEVLNLRKQIVVQTFTSLQPIVCNIRKCAPGGDDIQWENLAEGVVKVHLLPTHTMSVIDGQHRRYAASIVREWLFDVTTSHKYPTKGIFDPGYGPSAGNRITKAVSAFYDDVFTFAQTASFVSIECHLGLSIEQERQLFTDLNSKGRKVSVGQTLEYDSSDPVNRLVHAQLDSGEIACPVTEQDASDWARDDGALVRKDLNKILSFLLLGKGNSNNAAPGDIDSQKPLAKKFWGAVFSVKHFGKAGAKSRTVLAQSVVLYGLAKLIHELGLGKPSTRDEVGLKKLWAAIESGELDFSHNNPLWRSLMLSREDRAELLPGVEKYVHVPAGTNLDAGTFNHDEGWVRYGSRHNDIYRRIGDLIRFELNLKPRGEITRAIEKERNLGSTS